MLFQLELIARIFCDYLKIKKRKKDFLFISGLCAFSHHKQRQDDADYDDNDYDCCTDSPKV